jgi:fibronectin type 3 domain-containing protein
MPTEPTITATSTPTVTPTASSTGEPTAAKSTAPALPSVGLTQNEKLMITDFRVQTKKNGKAVLTWSLTENASSYSIYRSTKKNGSYKLLKTVQRGTTKYSDKVPQIWSTYYYYIVPCGITDGAVKQGEKSALRSYRGNGVRTPTVTVRKGKKGNVKYITVNLKKYGGKYVEIYISKNGSKYKKLKLKSNKIARYKGKYKIRYVVKNTKINVKVRTYLVRKKKKVYSSFSKESEVQT